MNTRPFVTRSFDQPADYVPRVDAPPLIGEDDTDIVRYNLFEEGAPDHSRKYMNGIDVVSWKTPDGTERSHLIIDQKAGSLVLPWEVSNDGGVWLFLQETYRAPHSKDERSVKELLAQDAFDALGVWSLEAPAGGIKHVDGVPVESPRAAGAREVTEETGLLFEEKDLLDLLPGGLQIGGDVNTKRSYLFAADVAKGSYDEAKINIEADEAVADLLAFKARDRVDIAELTARTRLCSSTTPALALLALQPDVYRHLS